MDRERGKMVYAAYRLLSHVASPAIRLHLRWRKLRGLEHPLRWTERLGRPSLPRPTGPLLWFHAVSLGEGMAAIPVIKRCIERRPDVNILMTTTTLSAFEVIKNWLPVGVIYQIILALVNARMSEKSFNSWSGCLVMPLISLLLSKFSLIAPLSNLQAIHFQLLQAPPTVISFCGDLKYVMEEFDISNTHRRSIEELQTQLKSRKVWMASSVHTGEEEVMLGAHKLLKQLHPDIVTILVPRHPQHGLGIARKLLREGVSVALRSRGDNLMPGTSIYIMDTLGELRYLYKLTPIAVIGGSFLPHLAGHNISEAAASGCAVLTGPYVGHFAHMLKKMQRFDHASVIQVSGKEELEKALSKLFSDPTVLETHRSAARRAIYGLSSGIIENIWVKLNYYAFRNTNFETKAVI